jgi:hypothetical protein
MHFATFPMLTGRPADLAKLVEEVTVAEMHPGETIV